MTDFKVESGFNDLENLCEILSLEERAYDALSALLNSRANESEWKTIVFPKNISLKMYSRRFAPPVLDLAAFHQGKIKPAWVSVSTKELEDGDFALVHTNSSGYFTATLPDGSGYNIKSDNSPVKRYASFGNTGTFSKGFASVMDLKPYAGFVAAKVAGEEIRITKLQSDVLSLFYAESEKADFDLKTTNNYKEVRV